MPPQLVPVFVSSTWLDLRPEREAVRDAVLSMKETQFVGMEYFGGRDETTRQASLEEVDRSLVYVGIVAGRYGSGVAEAEYERARERGLPCFVYFKSDATIPDGLREKDPAQLARLEAFKQKLRAGHLNAFDFRSADDLAAKVTADLHRWLFDNYLTPKLQAALRGEVTHADAQALLDAVKDLKDLNGGLLTRLRGAGFNLAFGERSVAFTGIAEHVNINTGDTHVHLAGTHVTPTLRQLRAPVGDFVGRGKEVGELLAALRGGTSAAVAGISGMGGVGKTELSFYVADRLRDAYPDAQLVLDMRGTDDAPRDPADALASCVRAFHGLEYKTPDNLDDLTRLYRSTLEGRRALILLDNAHDGAQVRPLLPPAGSALLVTSRNALVLPHMRRVTLDQLSASEARELLTRIAPRVAPDAADQVCYLCGYLPLAIRAAGSLLEVTADLDPPDYAAQLRDERTRLELIGGEGVDYGVEASFNLSYARLSPDAARVFRQLAVFPASFDAAAEEFVCEDPGHKHLTGLLRRSLVLYNPDARRYRLHDLARLFAGSRLGGGEREAGRMRHARQYLRVVGECNDLYLKGGSAAKSGLVLFDAERRNVEAGQRWACQRALEDEAAKRLCSSYPHAGRYVFVLRQRPREIILWREAALAAARQLKDRAAEGWHLGNLGLAYGVLGETRRAIECEEAALVIARETGNRRNEGIALNNLGNAYLNLAEIQRSLTFYEQGLAISREVGDRRGEADALSNLGSAHLLSGDRILAVRFYHQALVVSREIGDRFGEGTALGNLGVAYGQLGQARLAVEFQQQYLAIAREIGDRQGEGNALLNLALDNPGGRAQAIAHAEAALEIFERLESPKAGRVRAKLAEWRAEATKGE